MRGRAGMARLPRPCASCQLRITPLPRPRASRLRDGVRLSVRGPGSVNGNGAGVYNAIPDANVRRGAAVVAVSGEGDAAGIYCCGSSNDTAEGGRFMSVGAHVSGVRVTADCEVAVVALISHVPGNAADAPLVSISRRALTGCHKSSQPIDRSDIREWLSQDADSCLWYYTGHYTTLLKEKRYREMEQLYASVLRAMPEHPKGGKNMNYLMC